MPTHTRTNRLTLALVTVLATSIVGCQSSVRTDFTGRIVTDGPPREPNTQDLEDAARIVAGVAAIGGYILVGGCGGVIGACGGALGELCR